MSERFFLDEPPRSGRATLSGDEARHLARVLRAKVGDDVRVFDGSGSEWIARVGGIGRDRVDLEVERELGASRPPDVAVVLAVALPKGERQKWMVEKLTELGVARLVPLVTTRGVAEATPAAIARLRRGVIEACKQCGRNTLMEITEARSLDACLAAKPATTPGIVADPGGVAIGELLRAAARPCGGEVMALVGPEGGFTDAELAAAKAAGFMPASLGPHILRVETAAIALAAAIMQAAAIAQAAALMQAAAIQTSSATGGR